MQGLKNIYFSFYAESAKVFNCERVRIKTQARRTEGFIKKKRRSHPIAPFVFDDFFTSPGLLKDARNFRKHKVIFGILQSAQHVFGGRKCYKAFHFLFYGVCLWSYIIE